MLKNSILRQTEINLSNACSFDIEGNGFYDTISTVHCMWIKDFSNGHKWGFRPDQLHDGIHKLQSYDCWFAHNGLDYDVPSLIKLGYIKDVPQVLDTLVLSRLLFPDRPGGHSLEAWGKRLGLLKGDLMDEEDDEPEKIWEVFTEDMFTYCERDTDIQHLLGHHLIKELEKWK